MASPKARLMHPLLASIGPIPIHTYGVMIALGFLGGTWINRWLASRSGVDPEAMVDASFWGMMVGFLGARLVFVLTRLPQFIEDPMGIFRIWEGGLVFWGGPIAVILWGIYWFPRHKLPYWKGADIAIHGLVVGHILGRFGCVAAGCCYGKPTGTDFGLRFHGDLIEPALRGVALHPVQLYESFSLMILLAGLLWVHKRKVFDGQVLLTYLLIYPILRSIIEIYRGDLIRGFVIEGWLSTSQFISILVFAAAALTLRWRLGKVRAGMAEVRA